MNALTLTRKMVAASKEIPFIEYESLESRHERQVIAASIVLEPYLTELARYQLQFTGAAKAPAKQNKNKKQNKQNAKSN